MASEVLKHLPGGARSYTHEEEQLLLAASCGDVERVKKFLNDKTKEAVDLEGRSALHLAANNGHCHVVESLVHFGSSVRHTDNFGQSALQRAASQGHLNIVKYLLRKHSLVDHQDDIHGNTALHEASWRGFSQTVEVLCKAKVNVYIRNKAGFAPLHLCCQNGHNQTCRVLLTYGCKPNVKNNYGDTPLHTACRYGHAGVVRILISARSTINDQNKNGDTALHIAAAMGRRKLTRILLESACDATIKNKQNETALDITRRKMFLEVESMIMNPPDPVLPSEVEARGRSRQKRDKRGRESGASSKGSTKQRRKKKSTADSSKFSPYGCHYFPDTDSFPQPKLDSLPTEPLKKGEQYYLDLAGNIKKGPIGYGLGCQCGPMFHRVSEKIRADKKDIINQLGISNEEIDRKLVALEKKTRHQLQHLHQTIKERLAAERVECLEKTERMCRRERLRCHEESVKQVEALKQELHTWLQYRLEKMEAHGSVSSSDTESVHSDDSALPKQRSRSVGVKKTRPSAAPADGLVRSRSEEQVPGSGSSEDLTQMLCSIAQDLVKEEVNTYKGLRVLDYPSQRNLDKDWTPPGSEQVEVQIHPSPVSSRPEEQSVCVPDECSTGKSTPTITPVFHPSDSDYSPASSKRSAGKSTPLEGSSEACIKPIPVKCPEVPLKCPEVSPKESLSSEADVYSKGNSSQSEITIRPELTYPNKPSTSHEGVSSFLHHKYEMRPPDSEQRHSDDAPHSNQSNDCLAIPIPPPMPNTRYSSISRMRGYNDDKHYRFRTFFPSNLGIPTVPPGTPAFTPIGHTVMQYSGLSYTEPRPVTDRLITEIGEDNGSEHNDSGYSTKFCGSHKGSSPALSAATDETDGSEVHWRPLARNSYYRWDSYRSDKSEAMIHGRSSLV